MPEDVTPHTTATVSLPPLRQSWPWGQVGWFLAGSAFCLMGIGDVGALLGFLNHSSGECLKLVSSLFVLTAIGCSVPAVLLRRRAKRHGARLAHLPWLRRVNFGLLAAAVSLIMLALIIPALQAGRIAHSQAVAAGPWSDHAFANGSWLVSTPGNWEPFPDPALSSSGICLVDRLNDLHLIVSVTPKQDLAIQTLAELSQQATQTLGKNATNLAVGERQITEVDGQQAVDQVVAGTFDGVNMCCYLRHVEYPDVWVELRQMTTRSRFEANEASFVKIAASLRRKH
jgi:hypothetical protein